MEHTTRTKLRQMATVLNNMLELDVDNAYYIEYAYGKPRLEKYVPPGKGAREISPRLKPGELKTWMGAYIKGIAVGQCCGVKP